MIMLVMVVVAVVVRVHVEQQLSSHYDIRLST